MSADRWLLRLSKLGVTYGEVQALRGVDLQVNAGDFIALIGANGSGKTSLLLFLDESTANLDPPAKNEIEALLQSFSAEGMTLVMSTHNLGQAKRLASRVVYLEHGSIRADQPTAEFFNEHVDDRTGLFLKGEMRWDLQ